MFLKQGAWNQIQQWNGIVSVPGFCATSFLCSKRLHVGALTKNQRICDLFHITFSLCPSWLCAPLKQDQANQGSNQKIWKWNNTSRPTHSLSSVCKCKLWLWNRHYLFSLHSCTVQRQSLQHQVDVFRFLFVPGLDHMTTKLCRQQYVSHWGRSVRSSKSNWE